MSSTLRRQRKQAKHHGPQEINEGQAFAKGGPRDRRIARENESIPEIAARFKEHPLVQTLSETFQARPELILKAFEILDRKSRKE